MSLEKILQKECRKRSFALENFSYLRNLAQGSTSGYFIQPQKAPKACVLFAHGFGNDCLFPQMPFLLNLVENGIAVFTFDLDGHGARSNTLLLPEQFLSCIHDAIQFVKRKGFAQNLHLIGHSLGALLSLHACAQEDFGLSSLVLVSLPTDIRFQTSVLMSEAFLSVFTGSFYSALGFFKGSFLPALGPMGRSRFPLRFSKNQTRKESAKELVHFIRWLQKKPVPSPVPTLYCYGTLDRISPLQKDQLQIRPRDELFILKGETHLTTISSKRIAKKICEWVLLREPSA